MTSDPVPAPLPALPPEVVPVRPGEDLAWDRLESYLRSELPLRAQTPVEGGFSVLQFPNGSANLTYLLTFGSQRFVLRRPPFGTIAPGAHDMKREYRVLSKLWRVYDRAPRSYLLCEDHDVVGSDFVISEYRTGVVIWGVLPPGMAGVPGASELVGFAAVDALADLHLVDPVGAGLADLGRPEGYLARQVDGWRKRWELVATANFDPLMAPLGDELRRRLPTTPRSTLIHNDFKIDNCQFAPDRPERVTAVFDWDQATLGDPLADFGMLMSYWPDPSDIPTDRALTPPGLDRFGLPTRRDAAARYAERTGFDLSTLPWYEAFTTWKTCVVLQQLHQRYVRGESTDPRMADKGDNIEMLARRAARILGSG
jgi:aminoglycoside phosphotransferase (APT) family kinase protein